MDAGHVMSSLIASGGSEQGYSELTLVVVFGVVGVVLLVVGVVLSTRGSGRPRWWFALGVGVLIVGALALALI